MFKELDDFLNNITMYRLLLYFLIVLAGVGLFYSFFNILPFSPIAYLFSFAFILSVSYIANWVFAKTYEAPTNVESFWISALILGLIITPPKTFSEVIFIGFAASLTMGSKFIFALEKKHIFNPVAIAVFLTATFINGSPSWWIGTPAMLPIVSIGGYLIVRKIRRWDLALSFFAVALTTTFVFALIRGSSPISFMQRSVLESPLIFFASIMLTEPLTTPPTRDLRILYGGLVGLLFSPQIHLGSIYTTPEMALIIGNIFSYIVSPKYKLMLVLKQKLQISPDTYDFIFSSDKPIRFTPGQYMEFTFEHSKPDSRGNRRYLSLASSPAERDIRLGIKFDPNPSSYKKNLLSLDSNQKIAAGQLIGDFTMPKDKTKKLVFIAGGIGITPFRSMLKYLIDAGERRDIVLVYSAKANNEFVYKDVIDEAQTKLGIKVIYNASSINGHIDANILAREIPDYRERIFYLSGSHSMVKAFEGILKNLKINSRNIVMDYFPGLM